MITATLRASGEESVVHFVEGTFLLGSAHDCNAVVMDAAPRQCKVFKNADGRFVIKDLTGMEETLVNGESVAEHVLEHGDTLKIGTQEFLFEVEENAGAAADPDASDLLGATATAPSVPSVRRRGSTRAVPRAAARLASRRASKTVKMWVGVCLGFLGVLFILILIPKGGSKPRKPVPETPEPVAKTEPDPVVVPRKPEPVTVPEPPGPEPRPEEGRIVVPSAPLVSLPATPSKPTPSILPPAPVRPTPRTAPAPPRTRGRTPPARSGRSPTAPRWRPSWPTTSRSPRTGGRAATIPRGRPTSPSFPSTGWSG